MALMALNLGLSIRHLLLLILVGLVSGQRVAIERPSDFPVSECPERYSCGVENQPPWTQKKLQVLNCYCDDLCETYDDCCEDHASKFYPSRGFQLPLEVVSCRNLGAQYELLRTGDLRRERFYIVNRCPSHYSDECVRGKCELHSSSPAADESFYRLPVNGRQSRVLYQNYFCALCNGDEDVVFWTGRVDFSEVKYLEAHGQSRLSQTPARFLSLDEYKPRPCKSVIRHCHRDWTNDKVRDRCVSRAQSNTYVYAFSANFLVYRNVDCAICNRVADAKAGCFNDRPDSPYPSSPPPEQHPSLSLFFNVSAHSVSTIQTIDHRNWTQTIEYFRCKQDAIYDPFTRECRPIFCPSTASVNPPPTKQPAGCPTGQTMTERGCVAKTPDDVDNTDDQPPPIKPPKCDRWYVLDRSARVCRPVMNGRPCPKGYKLTRDGCSPTGVEFIDKPLPVRRPKCDRWYVYDRSAHVCRAVARCKGGQRLTDDGCVPSPKISSKSPKCPRWFVYDRKTDDCRLGAKCPVGYVLMNNGCEYKIR